MKDENNLYDLNQLLREKVKINVSYFKSIDLNDPMQNISWLPLNAYDDVTMETLFVDDLIEYEKTLFDDEGEYQVTGKVVAGTSFIQIESAEIVGFDVDKQKFKVIFADGRRKLVPRIYLCFDHEDHKNWIERYSNAWWKRVMACSLLKKNCFLDAMPTEHLSELSAE